jgi:hypothetical protein
MRTKLVIVEELRSVSKSELANKLHPWITQPEMSVNEKNLPSFTLEQVIAFAFMSNRLDAIKLDTSDRRYLVLKTEAMPHKDDKAYYVPLYDLLDNKVALGAILHQNSGETPYSYQAVTLDEISEAMPHHIRGSTGYMIEAMEQSGYWAFPQQIRPGGGREARKIRVWLHSSVEGRETLSPGQVRQIYKDERTGRGANPFRVVED